MLVLQLVCFKILIYLMYLIHFSSWAMQRKKAGTKPYGMSRFGRCAFSQGSSRKLFFLFHTQGKQTLQCSRVRIQTLISLCPEAQFPSATPGLTMPPVPWSVTEAWSRVCFNLVSMGAFATRAKLNGCEINTWPMTLKYLGSDLLRRECANSW